MTLSIITRSLPVGQTGKPYSAKLEANGGVPNYTWSGTPLPQGLSIDENSGVLSGTPKLAATSTVLLQVRDQAGARAATYVNLLVRAPALEIITTSPPAGVINAAYTFALGASGGVRPYSWAVTGGGLPPGLSLGSDGVVSGTPVSASTDTSVTVQVTDAAEHRANATVSFSIKPEGDWIDAWSNQDLFGVRTCQGSEGLVLATVNAWEPAASWTSVNGREWTPAAGDTTAKLEAPVMIARNGEIWMIGAGSYDLVIYVYKFDWATRGWILIATPALGRYLFNFCASWFDGRFWVMGGWADGGPSNVIWSSADGVTWTQSPTPPWSPRFSASLAAWNGRLWLTGGLTNYQHPYAFFNDLWSTVDGVAWRAESTPPWAAMANVTCSAFLPTDDKLHAVLAQGDLYYGPTSLALQHLNANGEWSESQDPIGVRQVNNLPIGATAWRDGRMVVAGPGVVKMYVPNAAQ